VRRHKQISEEACNFLVNSRCSGIVEATPDQTYSRFKRKEWLCVCVCVCVADKRKIMCNLFCVYFFLRIIYILYISICQHFLNYESKCVTYIFYWCSVFKLVYEKRFYPHLRLLPKPSSYLPFCCKQARSQVSRFWGRKIHFKGAGILFLYV